MSDNPFELFADEYDAWFDRNPAVFESEVRLLKSLMPEAKGTSLEVGVGTGRFASALKIGLGVDPAWSALKIAKARGLAVVRGIGEMLPFKSSVFDTVLVNTVLCFSRDPSAILNEIRRVLRPRGILIIGFIDRDSHLGALYSSRGGRFFSRARLLNFKEVEELLKSSGFSIEKVCQTIFSPPPWKIPEGIEEGWGRGGFVGVRARA